MIYFDHNATTPIHPLVAERISALYADGLVNPASPHRAGRQARKRLENARQQLTSLLGGRVDSVQSDMLTFTSGGTEANNWALFGLAGQPPGHIITTAIEHPSIIRAAEVLQHRGFEVEFLLPNSDGMVELATLEQSLRPDTRLVSIMTANNETGVLQPVQQASAICQAAGVAFHTDAVQAVGKIPLEFHDAGYSAMTIAAHKFYGPRGVGGLLVRHGTVLEPILWGGFQQLGMRPGTESPELAEGMWAAAELWNDHSTEWVEHMRTLRDQLEERLLTSTPAVVHGSNVPRLAHTCCVSFPGIDRQALVMALDLAGVAVSTGSACASGSSEPSPVLVAMGLPTDQIESAIRISLGALTTFEDMATGCDRIIKCVNDLRPA